MDDRAVQELLDKQAIREVIYRYSRGLDRMDKEMAYSVWHPDGTALYHDIFEGTGHEFVDWVWEAHEAMESHSHQMTNILIEVAGDRAVSETYAIVSLRRLPDENGHSAELVSRSRYLDRWSKRDGRWAIDHRIHVSDLQLEDGVSRPGDAESRRDPADPSFDLFRSLR
ncbi:MAG: nuclear transport factor 2 family protein [Proteobacteria bacterium]|nr:nuclear transport factor 2 family protein [Pseudomonadota bacterium]